MKFSAKLTLSTMALLCITLSVGGAFSIRQNFAASQKSLFQSSAAEHERTCFSLETSLCAVETEKTSDLNALSVEDILRAAESLARNHTGSKETFAVLSSEGSVFYRNIPQDISYSDLMESIHAQSSSILYRRTGEKPWILLSTSLKGLSRPLYLTSAWDVTALFSERNRQIWQHFLLSIAVLTAAGGVTALSSAWLTKPLRRLEQASAALAEGSSRIRVEISSKDELETLGQTFNRMADSIEHQMSALQEESSRQKRFVAAFSHELKTPMTAILGYASMLEKGQLLPEQQRKAAGYIARESARLETLSRELLRLMKLQEGGIETSPASLKPLLQKACDSLPDLSASVRVNCPADTWINANAPLLLDLVRNLLLNSAAAEPKDGLVHIECCMQESGWKLCVWDNGRGIPEPALAKITEPFYRVDAGRARSQGGNGLGLALCRMIAQAHGDDLHIESKEGEGTRVWLLVPSCPESASNETESGADD